MEVGVVTLFPEMFAALTDSGISRRACQTGLLELRLFNPRDYTTDRHRTVDDRPYGGGPGMVMAAEPLEKAIDDAKRQQAGGRVIYLSPQGPRLTQGKVNELARQSSIILLCGRYEGVDERLISRCVDEELSIGDYVVSGGELPAMVLIDAMVRRLPGALGHEDSAAEDSFAERPLLDCPHYTRPEIYAGEQVPQVLLSGDHERIARWRLLQGLLKTRERRPDLFAQLELSEQEIALLDDAERDDDEPE